MGHDESEPIDEALADASERDFGALQWTAELDPPPTGAVGFGLTITAICGLLLIAAAFGRGIFAGLPDPVAIPLDLLVALGLVVGLVTIHGGIRTRRFGPLLLHLFERGFIAERVNGSAISARLADLRAELLDHDRFDEHGRSLGRLLSLRIIFNDDTAWFVSVPAHADTGALVELAERSRAMTRSTVTNNRAMLLRSRDVVL